MVKFKFMVWTVAIVGGLLISSCTSYKTDAKVAFSEYTVSEVSVASVGDKNANYEILKPFTATASVDYIPGGFNLNRQIHIDGRLVYDYEYNPNNPEGQWLKNFNSTKLELGFIAGSSDQNSVTHPNPRALARQLAYAKIIKELMSVSGDAITTPVISTEIVGTSYNTVVKTNLIKLNPSK